MKFSLARFDIVRRFGNDVHSSSLRHSFIYMFVYNIYIEIYYTYDCAIVFYLVSFH